MTRKRILLLGLVTAVLLWLVYLQVRQWRRFDWPTFWSQTDSVRHNWWMIVAAIALIYAADSLRALRWALFLRPVRPTPPKDLVAAQFIGFTGLALLGRPGELIRPYLIARRTGLTLSSQIAVWTVERLFDIAAVTALLVTDIFFAKSLRELGPSFRIFEKGALFMLGVVILGMLLALAVRKRGTAISNKIESMCSLRFPRLGKVICQRIQSFSEGLNTIHDLRSFVGLSVLSIIIWSMIAGSYSLVTASYSGPLSQLGYPQVILLMFGSVAGGVLQLPIIGGGSQLATIFIVKNVFDLPPELATSCGILLWLVTFVSVTPLGLLLARREHFSLRDLAKQEQAEMAHSGGSASR